MFVIRNIKKIYFKELDRNWFKYYSIFENVFILLNLLLKCLY